MDITAGPLSVRLCWLVTSRLTMTMTRLEAVYSVLVSVAATMPARIGTSAARMTMRIWKKAAMRKSRAVKVADHAPDRTAGAGPSLSAA